MKNTIERVMHVVFAAAACTSILALGLICLFLLQSGIPGLQKIGFVPFMFGQEWSPTDVPPEFGILPMIAGSVYITFGAILIGVPIGILTAVYLARVCPKEVYRVLKPGLELLAGIPSVVYGFFGMAILVPIFDNSIASASILLGLMILPTVINIAEAALRAVPENYYEGALALGAGPYRSVFHVVLPAARSGILASVVLGIGRALGETMAVIMVAGNQPRMPISLFAGARTLTANIVMDMSYAGEVHREALIATGLVLFVFILLINLCFSVLNRSKK